MVHFIVLNISFDLNITVAKTAISTKTKTFFSNLSMIGLSKF